jgi:hypothetical protein
MTAKRLSVSRAQRDSTFYNILKNVKTENNFSGTPGNILKH